MKKIVSLITMIALLLGLSTFVFASEAVLESPDPVTAQFQSELCKVFPELEEMIYAPQTTRSVFSEKEVIQTFEKEIDHSTLYRLSLYNDGTYAATRIANYSLSGGTSSSGTGYSSLTGATLTFAEVRGPNDSTTVVVSPVSYTFVNGGYDYISDVGSFCVATEVKPDASGIGHAQNYTGSRASFISHESASGPAVAFYYIENYYTLELMVGSDQFRVRWNGSYV